MLARLCLLEPHQLATASPIYHEGLGDYVLKDCALLCIESAQTLADAIHEIRKPDGTVGIINWWSRFFHLYSASTILIAAMLRPDLFTPAVSRTWSRTMLALRAHEHLSPVVRQCITAFQTLSCRIMETHPGGRQFPPPEGSASTYFQDCFQEVGLEPDNFLFGAEDMSWLTNFTDP